MNEVISLLESKGHDCMMYNMSKKMLEWCNKDVCIRKEIREDMAKRNKEAIEFGESLKKDGHKCVMYLESYPVQIIWCNQE